MTDDENATYDVILNGFGPGDPAEHQANLARAFGIPKETAAKFIAQMPTAVSRNVNRVRAEYFQRALEQAGAHTRLQAHGVPPSVREVIEPAAATPGPTRQQPAASPPSASGATTKDTPPHALEYASEPSAALSRPPAANTLVAGSPNTASTRPAPHPRAQAAAPSPRPKSPFKEASVVPLDLQLTQLDAPDSVSYSESTAPYAANIGPAPAPILDTPSDSQPDQWGNLMGLSSPAPNSAAPKFDTEAQKQFIPAEIEVSSGNLALSESPADVRLELDDSHLPQLSSPRPQPPHRPPRPDPESRSSSPARQSAPLQEELEPEDPEPTPARTSLPSSVPPQSSFPDRARGPSLQERIRDEYGNLLVEKGRRIERSVWHALGVVFTGQGLTWIATLSSGFALNLSVFHAATSVPGWLSVGGFIFAFVSLLGLLGLNAEFYEQVFWSSARGKERMAGTPSLRPQYLSTGYVRAGVTLLALGLLGFGPAIAALLFAVATGATNEAVLESRFLRLLIVAPLLYVPMALTTASMAHRPLGSWSVPTGVRALFRAPLRYAFATVSAGLTAAMSSGTFAAVAVISGQPMWWLATLGLPIAVGTAISGAMMGDLVRDRPDLFR